MNGLECPRRALRAARSAPLFEIGAVAAAAGVSSVRLVSGLARSRGRSRCTELASQMLRLSDLSWPYQIAAAHPAMPPGPARRADFLEIPGVAGWAARGRGDKPPQRRYAAVAAAAGMASVAPLEAARLAFSDNLAERIIAAAAAPAAVLAATAQDWDLEVRRAVLSNPACPVVATVAAARREHDLDILATLAETSADAATLTHLADRAVDAASGYSGPLLAKIAANHATPAKVLAQILASVADTAAATPSQQPDRRGVLRILARNQDAAIRSVVAQSADVALFAERLRNDIDAHVRSKLASNPSCPAVTLDRLASDDVPDVRTAAATNSGCSPRRLTLLVQDSNIFVAQAAAANPRCPPQALRLAALSSADTIRGIVATNPACPDAALADLCSDRVVAVCAAATRTRRRRLGLR